MGLNFTIPLTIKVSIGVPQMVIPVDPQAKARIEQEKARIEFEETKARFQNELKTQLNQILDKHATACN